MMIRLVLESNRLAGRTKQWAQGRRRCDGAYICGLRPIVTDVIAYGDARCKFVGSSERLWMLGSERGQAIRPDFISLMSPIQKPVSAPWPLARIHCQCPWLGIQQDQERVCNDNQLDT